MAEYENIKNQLDKEKNKLLKLEIEINAIDSDSYFYQKNNDLDKLNELSSKKENLTIQLNSQKELVKNLQSQFDSIKSKKDADQKEEYKKEQEKILHDKLEKDKEAEKAKREKERIAREKLKKQKQIEKEKESKKTRQQSYNNSKPRCPKCGAIDNGRVRYCPKCGYQLRTGSSPDKWPKGRNNHDNDNGNWFIRLFLKKKKDDGTYRFSISKIIGSIYAILEFCSGLFSFYFPENIIVSIIAAGLVYLVCLIIGYIIRWIYNKYIK